MKGLYASPIELIEYGWRLSCAVSLAVALGVWLNLSRWKLVSKLGVVLSIAAALFVIGEWVIWLLSYNLNYSLSVYLYTADLARLLCTCFLSAGLWAWRCSTQFPCKPFANTDDLPMDTSDEPSVP